MRTPVALDGTAVVGVGTLLGLRVDLPGVLWAASDPTTGAHAPEASTGGATKLPTPPDPSQSLMLVARPPTTPFQRAVGLRVGSESIPLVLPAGNEERSRGPGHVQEAGPSSLTVVWPPFPSEREKLSRRDTDLVIWTNARAHFRAPASFVAAAAELREAIGPAPMLWAPGIALPGNLAFLHYLGLDLLDTTLGYHEAIEGAWLYPEFEIGGDRKKEPLAPFSPDLCGCPACHRGADTVEARLVHAARQYQREESLVRFHLRMGRLRELVEARTASHPEVGTMLRHLDEVGYDYQERSQPVAFQGIRPYAIESSYHRPEIERFRRRFLERYAPPPSKKVLLLVPCSYTKPYSNSPTHRAIARAIEGSGDPALIHLVSVTSPLGVVPQELENFYPARNYDIPVTGFWSEEERTWVQGGVDHLLASGSYERVVAHLPQGEFSWLSARYPPSERWRWTLEGEGASSREGLARLESTVRSLSLGHGSFARIRKEEVASSLSFQFSREIAERLLQGETTVRGPRWFLSLTESGRGVLATWKEDRGLWRLTSQGAAKVLELARDWWVDVDAGVPLRGDLFAPGAHGAGSEVRIGGNVILVKNATLAGVGEAVVPGSWMGRIPRGLVVRVRAHAGEPMAPEGKAGSATWTNASGRASCER